MSVVSNFSNDTYFGCYFGFVGLWELWQKFLCEHDPLDCSPSKCISLLAWIELGDRSSVWYCESHRHLSFHLSVPGSKKKITEIINYTLNWFLVMRHLNLFFCSKYKFSKWRPAPDLIMYGLYENRQLWAILIHSISFQRFT